MVTTRDMITGVGEFGGDQERAGFSEQHQGPGPMVD
jgi:hypothetical protein